MGGGRGGGGMYGHGGGGGGFHGNDHHGPHHGGGGFGGRGGHDDWGKRPGEDLDGPPSRMRKMDTRWVWKGILWVGSNVIILSSRSPDGSENGMRRDGLGGAKSITDLAKRVEKSWEGGLILKNSLFPTKLLLTEGEMEVRIIVNSLDAMLTCVCRLLSSWCGTSRTSRTWRSPRGCVLIRPSWTMLARGSAAPPGDNEQFWLDRFQWN